MKTHLKLSAAVAALALLGGCGALRGKGPARTPVVGQRVPILASENLAEVDPALANLQVVLPLAETNADWAQPGGNPSKSMGHVALGDTLRQAWSARIEGGNTRTRLAAAPVVAGGRLYVIDVNGMVTAMAADTGATVWTAQAVKGDENPRARFGGGVSVDGNRAFATDGLGDVVAFDTADGKEVWRAKPGGPLRGAPTVANGQVYVVSQDNQLFALDQADGKVVWTQSGSLEAQGVFGVAAPATGQGTVVAGF
ncbi:MAG: pyrrolo-quinoline quinone, partial [Sphingomonas hengshuiensis]